MKGWDEDLQKFLDTNCLLFLQQKAFEEHFLISSITLTELESIKTSGIKTEELRWSARQILHLLDENSNCYSIITYDSNKDEPIIQKFGLLSNNDSKIIAGAYRYYQNNKDLVFVTADLACKAVAASIGLDVDYLNFNQDDSYTGFKLITMDEEELANFYLNLVDNKNPYGLLENEYIIIQSKEENKVIDKYKWKDSQYIQVPFTKIESKMFGKIAPYKGDIYQQCALDSLCSNQITVMRGKPGSGKSWLAVSYLISQLEKGRIDKIIIFANNVAVRGAGKLGFYPGSKNDKLLDSQIGNFLISKLGSITEVERMIEEGSLLLLPVADLRGFDTSGMKAGILVTEAQNTSVDMMKLMLQRIGEDCIAVIEGDDEAQVDMSEYAGSNNGLRRLSEVFRGKDMYGEIKLQNIYRSKIAAIADAL